MYEIIDIDFNYRIFQKILEDSIIFYNILSHSTAFYDYVTITQSLFIEYSTISDSLRPYSIIIN
jgi:hypothetical protein